MSSPNSAPSKQGATAQQSHRLTIQILIAMLTAAILGTILRVTPIPHSISNFLVHDIFESGGTIFINILKMLVVPIVLISLIDGVSSMGDIKTLGRVGLRAVALYVLTTAIAIALAILVAKVFSIGHGLNMPTPKNFSLPDAPSIKQVLVNLFPSNPIKAMQEGNMLQIIVFALLIGIAISITGKPAEKFKNLISSLNAVLMKLILLIMKFAPIGVFCLIANLFAKQGLDVIAQLASYFVTVLVVLVLQLFVVYFSILKFVAHRSPIEFIKNMYSVMLFAFSTSSSNATLPITLNTVINKLNVPRPVASFVIPLGATINMDGTAIMQGVATVFIAHAFAIHIGIAGFLTVILMATLASIGTAGVPSVGLITLAMVLEQVHIPVAGIALIIGVDRLLDMARTAVNVCGDAMVACVVSQTS